MIIYGTATLAACMFVGMLIGDILGVVTGIHSNVGGVGFAMVLLILVTSSKKFEKRVTPGFSQGITFWQNMYTPVVIAMTASQNVAGAIDSGAIALLAGLGSVAAGFALLPLINKVASKGQKEETV